MRTITEHFGQQHSNRMLFSVPVWVPQLALSTFYMQTSVLEAESLSLSLSFYISFLVFFPDIYIYKTFRHLFFNVVLQVPTRGREARAARRDEGGDSSLPAGCCSTPAEQWGQSLGAVPGPLHDPSDARQRRPLLPALASLLPAAAGAEASGDRLHCRAALLRLHHGCGQLLPGCPLAGKFLRRKWKRKWWGLCAGPSLRGSQSMGALHLPPVQHQRDSAHSGGDSHGAGQRGFHGDEHVPGNSCCVCSCLCGGGHDDGWGSFRPCLLRRARLRGHAVLGLAAAGAEQVPVPSCLWEDSSHPLQHSAVARLQFRGVTVRHLRLPFKREPLQCDRSQTSPATADIPWDNTPRVTGDPTTPGAWASAWWHPCVTGWCAKPCWCGGGGGDGGSGSVWLQRRWLWPRWLWQIWLQPKRWVSVWEKEHHLCVSVSKVKLLSERKGVWIEIWLWLKRWHSIAA